MIKFFRHIRRSLINQNKMGKYFKYAFGEILLVVIGILIALSINNWNEHRKERIEEHKILQNILFDFEKASKELKELIEIREQQVIAFKKIYNFIETGTINISESELEKLLWLEAQALTYNSQTGTLDMLISSGKINIITNDELKNEILAWPSMVDDYTEEEKGNIELIRSYYLPVAGKHISMAKLTRSSNVRSYPFNEIPKGRISNNFKTLFKDPDYENLLTFRYIYTILNIEDAKNLIATADNITTIINKEINL